MEKPNVFKIPQAGRLADKYEGAGHGLAATVNGELIDYVYLRSEFPDFDGDSESVMELLDSPLIGPTVRRLQALGSVHVGMISCWEFVEL